MKIKSAFMSIIHGYKLYQYIAGVIVTVFLLIISTFYFSSYKNSNIYNVDFSLLHEDESDDSVEISLRGISLPKGSYSFAFGYSSTGEANMTSSFENDKVVSDLLPSSDGTVTSRLYTFDLKTGTDRGTISFTADKASNLSLAFITIASESHIYSDGIIWGILSLLAIPLFWIALWFYGKSSHKVSICSVTVLILLQVLPFIVTRGLIQGVDTRAHMMRIEGIYYGLLDGQFPVVVQPEWNNSYGQIGVLYPNLFLYIPAVFRLLGMSQLGACKFFLFMLVGSSGVISFAAARSIYKRDWQVTIAACCFMLSNMKMHDLLAGGKIGGSLLAEMFWPLLAAGLIEVFYRNRNKWYLLALGMAGVFCCHVTSASVACIAAFIILLLNIPKLKSAPIQKAIGRSILLFIGLTLGTLVCFVRFYFSDWGQDQLMWRDFLSTLWSVRNPFADNRWTSVMLIAVVCLILMVTLRLKYSKEYFRRNIKPSFVPALFICATFLLFVSTAYFPWKYLMNIPIIEYYTGMLQSGNRFLSLAGCLYSMCIPELLEYFVIGVSNRRSYQTRAVLISCLTILVLGSFNIASEEFSYTDRDDRVMLYYDEVVGELEYAFDDYLPKGTKSEWYASDTGFISDENAVQSLSYEREGTYIYYSYTNSAEGAYVEFPKFYYDGYKAEDEMAENVTVYRGDKNRVRVYLKVTDTPDIIRIWYHVPWYMTFASSLSIGLWIAVLMMLSSKALKRIQ